MARQEEFQRKLYAVADMLDKEVEEELVQCN